MNKLILMVGAPGSGKSTWSSKYLTNNPHTVILSSDKFRAIFGKDENDQSVTGRVFSHIKIETDEYLKKGNDVIIDATNVDKKSRKDWVYLAKKHNAKLIAYIFLMDRDTLVKRNQERGNRGGRNVPPEIIDLLLSRYVPPTKEEGFDEINFV